MNVREATAQAYQNGYDIRMIYTRIEDSAKEAIDGWNRRGIDG